MLNADSHHNAWVLFYTGNRISVVINDGLEEFRVTDDNARHVEHILAAQW